MICALIVFLRTFKAVNICLNFNSNCNYETKVLTEGDCDNIFQLVFSCHRPVAVAAAEFLNIELFQKVGLCVL